MTTFVWDGCGPINQECTGIHIRTRMNDVKSKQSDARYVNALRRVANPLRILCQHSEKRRNMVEESVAGNNSSHVNGGTFSTINGVRLHYEIRGNGMHPVICIPGALGSTRTFEPQLDYFGREGSGFQIVVFDPRGYGASQPVERFDVNSFVADAKDANALMQSLSLPKFSVMGLCSGGSAAIHLAALFPDNVRRMVIWSTKAYVRKEDLEIYDKMRDLSKWGNRILNDFLKTYGSSLKHLWGKVIEANNKIFNEGGNICMGEISQIKCHTLIIHGAKDELVPILHAHYLHKHVMGSRLEVMEDGNHCLHLKYSKEFNKIVEDFLE